MPSSLCWCLTWKFMRVNFNYRYSLLNSQPSVQWGMASHALLALPRKIFNFTDLTKEEPSLKVIFFAANINSSFKILRSVWLPLVPFKGHTFTHRYSTKDYFLNLTLLYAKCTYFVRNTWPFCISLFIWTCHQQCDNIKKYLA